MPASIGGHLMARDDVDPSDRWDIDGKLWGDERELRQRDANTLRLLADGRTATPMTVADMAAERAASRRAEFARYGDAIHTPADWTWGDRWGAA